MRVAMPEHSLDLVRKLAADESNCRFYDPVLKELKERGWDSDELRNVLECELGEAHWYKSEQTRKYYPGTVSDYYSIWIDEFAEKMFLKLIVASRSGAPLLVITSFKKDNRHV